MAWTAAGNDHFDAAISRLNAFLATVSANTTQNYYSRYYANQLKAKIIGIKNIGGMLSGFPLIILMSGLGGIDNAIMEKIGGGAVGTSRVAALMQSPQDVNNVGTGILNRAWAAWHLRFDGRHYG